MMLTSFRQKTKIHIPVLPDSLDRGEFLKKTFGYLKEAVGRYRGKRQAQEQDKARGTPKRKSPDQGSLPGAFTHPVCRADGGARNRVSAASSSWPAGDY